MRSWGGVAVVAATVGSLTVAIAEAEKTESGEGGSASSHAVGKKEVKMTSSKAYPYAALIPDTVAYCYNKIINDTSCCLDQKRAPGVRRDIVRRPNTVWYCGKGCYDGRKGRRGDDAIFLPEEADCDSPRLLWVHGGSWAYGSPTTDSYTELASKIAAASGAVVMVPDYPLTPVGNYSTIMDATLEALRYLATARLGELECKPEAGISAPLFIGGDSAGGGTALSMVLKLKIEGGWSPSGIANSHPDALPWGEILAGAIFFSPWTNLRCDTPDYYYNSFAKIVGAGSANVYTGDLMFRGRPYENLDQFTATAESYVGNNKDLFTDPVASPFFATENELGGGGLPPMYFAVGGSESILGDSLIFAQKAALYGADVQLDVHVGMWHDFPMYSEGCGSGEPLWQAIRVLNKTGIFIKKVAAAKRLTTDFGLQWPPSKYHPGTPQTSYVYDLTRQGTAEWFPKKLDAASLDIGRIGLAENPPVAAPSTDGRWQLFTGTMLGAFLVLASQALVGRARRGPELREAQRPLLEAA